MTASAIPLQKRQQEQAGDDVKQFERFLVAILCDWMEYGSPDERGDVADVLDSFGSGDLVVPEARAVVGAIRRLTSDEAGFPSLFTVLDAAGVSLSWLSEARQEAGAVSRAKVNALDMASIIARAARARRLVDGLKLAATRAAEDPDAAAEAVRLLMEREAPAASSASVRPPLFEPLEEILSRPLSPRWLVKGLIESPTSALVFGEPASGKSFLAVDLAAAVVSGGQWAGRDVITSGPVFYVAGEGKIGLARRFEAWRRQHDVTIPSGRLFISASRVELGAAGALAVTAAVDALTEECGGPALVVVDTLARALPGDADENNAGDIGAFMNVVDGIRDKYQCAVLVVHHSGHDKSRARGSSALKATLDLEMRVTKSAGGDRLLEFSKMKDGAEPDPVAFRLLPVPVGLEEDGMVVSSCVVDYQGGADRQALRTARTARMTPQEELGLCSLREAIDEAGGAPVSVDAWRPHFYSQHTGDSKGTKKTAFGRVRASLSVKKLIEVRDELYSLPSTKPVENDARSRRDLD